MRMWGIKEEKEEKGNPRAVWPAGKVLILVLGIVLAAAVLVGMGIWKDYRDAIIDVQKRQMLLTVQSLGESMELFLQNYAEDLEGLYQLEGELWFIEPGEDASKKVDSEPDRLMRDILQKYVTSHKSFVNDVMVENTSGENSRSIKHLKICQEYSISQMGEGKSLRLAELESGEMCLIIKKEVLGKGALSIVLDLEKYYQTLMRGLRVGTNGYMVLKDAEGIILMHPERAQWGIEVIHGRMQMYQGIDLKSLETMIQHQMEGQEGVEEYYSYWWAEDGYPRVRKISAYSPVQVGEDFLILSAVMDYDDIYIPVVEGVLRLVLLFLAFFLIMVAMAWYIAYMFLQKQKDTRKIAYLTELNHLLEEMHRSEETIAHQQRLQIMGTMTGGIAHEFNNLLTPIMGYADLLLMDLEEDSDPYDSALEIYEASVKAKEIIQQLSSLSRKNMETAYKDTDSRRMLTRALKMVRSVCPSNICLEEELCLEGENILCNETQMNQVILNICVNAIHAIDHKEGKIRVKARVTERKELADLPSVDRVLPSSSENWNHYICIEIRDNGCGMSKEIQNQIFDPFFTTKKGGTGTGLGLALVEQIIRSHKGGIYVESEPGRGSMFSLYLPVSEGRKTDIKTGALKEGMEEEQKEQLRLLVVDDNPKVLRLLEKDAAKLKIMLKCQMNFEEARRVLEESQIDKGFDALITEQEIGGKSGVDFCMSLQGKYSDMVMIVMADQVTRELIEAKQRRLVDAYIDKPVSVSSILEVLKGKLNNL